jgi:pilus assembly protein Flp/PilA
VPTSAWVHPPARILDLTFSIHSMYPMLYINAFITDEQAVTAIEYGLLAALIVIAVITGISATGTALEMVYDKWTTAVAEAIK